jgi:hypothetical protein
VVMIETEIRSDKRTVWVNSGVTGACIGRFGPMGIDIHKEVFPHEDLDGTECLSCTHEPATLADWRRFVHEMQKFYDITVGEEHRPTWLED